MWRVLCVEDDKDVAQNLTDIFMEWHDENPFGEFSVEIESDFERATARLRNEHFDLITLDLHGIGDPDPLKKSVEAEGQEGMRVLRSLRDIRFVPVIFYTGFAEKIEHLGNGLIHVVKKGHDDIVKVRDAARSIHKSGLPDLIRLIDEEKRAYMWDTVDKHWAEVEAEGSADELAYLLARRLGARFSSDSIKQLLAHKAGSARPIEMYVYPTIPSKIKTGLILRGSEGLHWVVVTPACDFAQNKVEKVLLVAARPLTSHALHKTWLGGDRWKGEGEPPSSRAGKEWNKLSGLLRNNAGDRWRYLPKTFFVPDLVLDLQELRQASVADVEKETAVCQLDGPYKEELLLHVSRYYGRIGTPDLETEQILARL